VNTLIGGAAYLVRWESMYDSGDAAKVDAEIKAKIEELELRNASQQIVDMEIGWPKMNVADPEFTIYNLDLHQVAGSQGDNARKNIEVYYRICFESKGMVVTTSCFNIWRKNKRANGHAKLVPAVPTDFDLAGTSNPSKPRIFFFDDNTDLASGAEDGEGICNLRHIETGEFVGFGVGQNGYQREMLGNHTIIHHSQKYRNVVIKANILDAIQSKDYFIDIIHRYSQPGEKIICYMDVNSTIMCNDAVQGKGITGSLLSCVFNLIELRPRQAFEMSWEGKPPVQVDRPMLLMSLVKEVTSSSKDMYRSFWTETTCRQFVEEVALKADLRWFSSGKDLSVTAYEDAYKESMASVQAALDEDHITQSWYHMFREVKAKGGCVVLNSFGVDTRKVVQATGLDDRKVLQIAVNHELWDARDIEQFQKQFEANLTIANSFSERATMAKALTASSRQGKVSPRSMVLAQQQEGGQGSGTMNAEEFPIL
jgi:hypothetical protein